MFANRYRYTRTAIAGVGYDSAQRNQGPGSGGSSHAASGV